LAESRRNTAAIVGAVERATGRADNAVLKRQAFLVELTDSLIELASRVQAAEARALRPRFRRREGERPGINDSAVPVLSCSARRGSTIVATR